MKKTNTLGVSILFFTLSVVMLGFGIIIPVMPFYIKSFGASGQSLGLLMSIYAIMQFIFAPLWGSLSDRFGRKPILLIGVLGNGLSHLLFGLSTELWMLFAARALAGMLSSATMPTAMAYISDSTSDHDRSGGMGKLSAAIGLGIILGPGIGGWLAAWTLSLPFYLAAALSGIALLLIACYLPESLPHHARQEKGSPARTISLAALRQGLAGPMAFLLVLSFLLDFGLTNFESIFGLFALDSYGYGPGRVGTVLMLVGVLSTIMQGTLAGPLTKRWGEERVIRFSLFSCAAAFLLLLAARTFASVMLAVGFFVVSNALLRPCVASLVSKRAEGGQGRALGLNNSFMSLGRIAGPVCAGLLYDVNIHLPYVSGAMILFAGAAASLAWLSVKGPEDSLEDRQPQPD